MDKAFFYKNDKVRWRREGDSECILYYNNKFMHLNEAASEIFHSCQGLDLAAIAVRIDSSGKIKVGDFLKRLLREGVITAGRAGGASLREESPRPVKVQGRESPAPQIYTFKIGACASSDFPRPSAPLRIFFTLTQKCNLSCKTCYNEKREDNSSWPEEENVNKVIDKIRDSGVLEVILTGGEPFLYPGIFGLIDYILSSGIKLRINTNGLLLTDELIQEIKKRKGVILTLGLDGISERTHDFIRGEGNFKKITAVMQRLSRSGIPLYINFTVTHKNLSEIWRLRRFCGDFNIAKIIMNIFIRVGRGYTQQSTLELTAADLIVLRTFGFLNRFGGEPEVLLVTSCYAGYLEANVDYKGSFYFCELLDYPLGNIFKKSMVELWDSPDIKSLMDPKGFKEPCRSCFFKARCRGSCRAEVFSRTGELDSGNPYCFKGKFLRYMKKSICG
ncbi:MAG: radical SAM protein [bacterium]